MEGGAAIVVSLVGATPVVQQPLDVVQVATVGSVAHELPSCLAPVHHTLVRESLAQHRAGRVLPMPHRVVEHSVPFAVLQPRVRLLLQQKLHELLVPLACGDVQPAALRGRVRAADLDVVLERFLDGLQVAGLAVAQEREQDLIFPLCFQPHADQSTARQPEASLNPYILNPKRPETHKSPRRVGGSRQVFCTGVSRAPHAVHLTALGLP
eukprot:137500-Rhodomonas_salina.3